MGNAYHPPTPVGFIGLGFIAAGAWVGRAVHETLREPGAGAMPSHESAKTPSPIKGLEFVFVKGGMFEMGNTLGDDEPREKSVHRVTVNDFHMGKYPVTQGQWKTIMGNNPSSSKQGDNYPVENVSWEDAQVFIQKLNSSTGKSYDLPTEAEWEYAARSGGNSSTSSESSLDSYAWYDSNSGSKTHPVGEKQPNPLGLYDMSGNVWEWCQDWYGAYSARSATNPKGPSSGAFRVLRGGSWGSGAGLCQSGYRHGSSPDDRSSRIGFRLVRRV